MKTFKAFLLVITMAVVILSGCNNYFHELMPPDGNRILSFSVSGQIGNEIISENTVNALVGKGDELHSLIPNIKISPKAIILPLTIEYLQKAFPQADFFQVAQGLYSADDLSAFVLDLIKENPDFIIPAINIPIDFSGPVNFIVISGMGTIRQYSVNIEIDEGLPRLISFVFSKYDNPELIRDAYSPVNENAKTINTSVLYPMEIELSYELIPVFEILGDKIIVDGNEISSGVDAIQFNKMIGTQEKIITVVREDKSLDFILTAVFSEDPDSIRSITDFRFTKSDNSLISINAVASIVNNDALGVINVQVFYSGSRPSQLTPRFISPGVVSVAGVTQISGVSQQDFPLSMNYKVVSRNNLYVRNYTVNVDFIDVASASPVIKSFKFSSMINHELVMDTTAQIIEGSNQIIIDALYGGTYPPETLTPEFSATGLVTVYNAVQVSGFSAQNFSRQVKYTVTNPENPLFTRDYYVQVRFSRDTSSDASMKTFSFHPDENPELDEEITGRIDNVTGKITINAPTGSGVSTRTMIPRFTAVGQVRVNNFAQTSGLSGQIFSSPVVYEVVSANGNNRREYTVTVRELFSTIYVDCDAEGLGDGSSWRDAFRSLKEACEAAALFPEDVPKEIWIAKGSYKPSASRNSEEYFLLTANTNYIGGFAGYETAKNQRSVASNTVTISGDLGGAYSSQLFGAFDGNAAKTINGDITFEDIAFNTSHANGSRTTGSAITSVQSNGSVFSVTNCTFDDFQSTGQGGAIYVQAGNIDINNTIFSNCTSGNTGGVIYAQGNNININDSDFMTCSSSRAAGGVLYFSGSGIAELQNININSVTNGGAVYSEGNSLKITNSEIKNITGTNSIYSSAGLEAKNLELSNITGAGIYVSGGVLDLNGITANQISGRSVYFYSSANRAIINNAAFDRCGEIYLSYASFVQVRGIEITNVNTDAANGFYANAYNGNIDIDNITINNVPNGRGMEISSTGTVMISNTSIKNTKTSGSGGGIYLNSGGNAVLSNITIENIEGGGAIYSVNKNITLNNSEIKTVTGTYGIYSGGGLSVEKMTLRDITGQGIHVVRGNLNLSGVTATDISRSAVNFSSSLANSAVIEKSAFDRCGDVSLSNFSSVQITDVNIRNIHIGIRNGLYMSSYLTEAGDIDIDNVTIENVPNGRGMEINTYGTVTITDVNIKNTKTTGINVNGGGIFLSGSGNAFLSSVTIENTEATGNGGGIYSQHRLKIDGSTVIKNVRADYHGGAIFLYDSGNTSSISGLTIDNATATREGGGIHSQHRLNITGSTVIKNVRADYHGGAIFLDGYGNTSSISGLTIENATARGSGGGIYSNHDLTISGSPTLIKNVSVDNNVGGAICIGGNDLSKTSLISGLTVDTASANNGGGIYFSNIGSLIINNSAFNNCSSRTAGGVIYISDVAKQEISNSRFINCSSVSAGGAIFAQNVITQEINNSRFENCTANSAGGAIWTSGTTLEIKDSHFENCRSNVNAGGIFMRVDTFTSFSIADTDFINCTAREYTKINYTNGNGTFTRCKFIHNNELIEYGSPNNLNSEHNILYANGQILVDTCEFTNLTSSNASREVYIFNNWDRYPSNFGGSGNGVFAVENFDLTLKNCTFNFKSGGKMGLVAFHSSFNTLLMDGVTINNPNNQQPIIWLNGNTRSDVYKFKTNNVYNGTLLNTPVALTTGLGSAIRLSSNAMPVLVP